MLMVLNLHSFWGYDNGTGILQVLDFFRESTSICAVNVFLLISGYFSIKWKFKSFYNLVFQIFFYSFGVYLIACNLGAVDFSINGLLSNLKGLYSSWSFITGYILLYFCSPFLNAFVEYYDNKHIFTTIIVILIAENFICRDYGFLNYGLLYLIGRFLNKSDSLERLQIDALKSYWIVTLLIFTFAYALFKFANIADATKMQSLLIGYSYAAPLVILQAVFLFLAFGRIYFSSKFINWCASSCLAIFLIHMHPAIKDIGYYAVTEYFYTLPVWQHCMYLFLLIVIVFFASILIDKLRIIISDFVYKIMGIVISYIPAKVLTIETYLPKSVNRIL